MSWPEVRQLLPVIPPHSAGTDSTSDTESNRTCTHGTPRPEVLTQKRYGKAANRTSISRASVRNKACCCSRGASRRNAAMWP